MTKEENIVLRSASSSDLDAVNNIIESCVMGWDLPERVKRLTLSSYRYLPHDLDHIELMLATLPDGEITGVAAWEPARYQDLPDNKTGILLHAEYS